MGNVQQVLNSYINEVINTKEKAETEILLSYLKNAVPKIEGEITPGKLKWRGIKLVIQKSGLGEKKWLVQRDKPISPKISYDYKNHQFIIEEHSPIMSKAEPVEYTLIQEIKY